MCILLPLCLKMTVHLYSQWLSWGQWDPSLFFHCLPWLKYTEDIKKTYVKWCAYSFRIGDNGPLCLCSFDDYLHGDPNTCLILFKANLPSQFPLFFLSCHLHFCIKLSIGSILGLTVNNHKATMIAQLLYSFTINWFQELFPITLLPDFLQVMLLSLAFWGFRLMVDYGFGLKTLVSDSCILYLSVMTVSSSWIRRKKSN